MTSATARIGLKSSNFDPKTSWQYPAVSRLSSTIRKNIKKQAFENGDKAVYLHSRIYCGEKEFTYWTCLDIEDPDNHSSIAANLEVAKEILIYLDDHGLTQNLSIFLSGSGLHFVWPYIVPQEYKAAFKSWIKAIKGIDASPQLNNAFLRMAGYRGNQKQGTVKDVHVHKLDNIHDLWFLIEKEYKDLVAGKPDYETSMAWLEAAITPKQQMPTEWVNFLDEWKIWSQIQDSVFRPVYPKKTTEVDWHTIYRHLENVGITWKEANRGDTWFIKLSSCPSCGRGDASPYVTSSGRLKCYHANSCEAGEQGDLGIIGLSASKWVPEYEGIEISTPDDRQTTSLAKARREIKDSAREPGDKLVIADPGVGKTTTILREIVPLCQEK